MCYMDKKLNTISKNRIYLKQKVLHGITLCHHLIFVIVPIPKNNQLQTVPAQRQVKQLNHPTDKLNNRTCKTKQQHWVSLRCCFYMAARGRMAVGVRTKFTASTCSKTILLEQVQITLWGILSLFFFCTAEQTGRTYLLIKCNAMW